MRRSITFALLPAAALALAACGGSSEGTTAPGTTAAATVDGSASSDPGTPTPGGSAAAVDMGEEMFGTAADVGGPYGELRDGVWQVGVAGQVEFRVTGPDSLELVGVGFTEGWEIRGQDVDSDKIDIDFRRGPVDYQFEVEMKGGTLEIEIDQDIDRTGSGVFAVGEAADVPLTLEGGTLATGEVALSEGWSETKRDVDNDDVELDFRRGGSGFFEQWELHADRDDGALDVEVDYEIEGAFSA